MVLAAALAGAVLAVPALSKSGPAAVAAKKKAKKKCKKAKKGKKVKKRKGCKSGGSAGATGLPGQATPSKPTPPDPPTTPPTLHVADLGVSPNTVLAPGSATGQVTLDAAAPSGGQQVDLQSDTARVTLPSYVVVAPGQTNASFPVNTTLGPPVTATLTGSVGASTATTQLSVVDTASVSAVKLERQCFTFGPYSSNRVSLDVPAPEDTRCEPVERQCRADGALRRHRPIRLDQRLLLCERGLRFPIGDRNREPWGLTGDRHGVGQLDRPGDPCR